MLFRRFHQELTAITGLFNAHHVLINNIAYINKRYWKARVVISILLTATPPIWFRKLCKFMRPFIFVHAHSCKQAAASAAMPSTLLPAKAEVMAKKYQFRGSTKALSCSLLCLLFCFSLVIANNVDFYFQIVKFPNWHFAFTFAVCIFNYQLRE